MKENIKCSIVVTSHNQADTIIQTLNSILTQTCTFDYEIIIGDDFSHDGTRTICIDYKNKYPEKIKLIFQDKNVGVVNNFINCVQKAESEYIAICAADDFWHNPNKLQLQVDFLEKNPDYGLIYTDYDRYNTNTKKLTHNWLKKTKKTIYEGANLTKFFFEGKVPALTVTVMFRKYLFDKYIPVEDFIKYEFPIEDWPIWLILSNYTKIAFLPDSTSTYRYGHTSLSNPQEYEVIEKKFEKEKEMYKYLCNMFDDIYIFDEQMYDNYIKTILLNLSYKKIDFKSAKKYSEYLIAKGEKDLKNICAQNMVTFYSFSFLKKFKRYFQEMNPLFFRIK